MKKIIALLAGLSLLGAGCLGSTPAPAPVVTQPAPSLPSNPTPTNPIPTPAPVVAPSPAPTPVTPPAPTPAPAPKPTPAKRVSVSIKNFAFSPATITVNKGDSVAFMNGDSVTHTATANNGSFDSGAIAAGTAFILNTSTLNPGTYALHCATHPSMIATLIIK